MKWRFHSAPSFFGILIPEDAVGHPAGGYHVGRAVVVHVYGPLAAVGDKLVDDAHVTVLVALPLAAVGAGILIPVGSAQDVWAAVAVHVESGNAFGVVGAQPVDGEDGLRNAAGSGAAGLDAVGAADELSYGGNSKSKKGECCG